MKNILFINDANWDILKKRISNIINLDISDYSDNFIKRRVEIRMRTKGITSYSDYGKLIALDKTEASTLSENLAIHVTRFFRDAETFDFIEQEVIPEIIKGKKDDKNKVIRVWSAGCSSGEEPITILMCLLEKASLNEDYDIQVIGTDRDRDIIFKAKSNFYETSQFSETSKYYIQKYFYKVDNYYKFKEDYSKLITYEVKDINRCEKRDLDLVLCRNTVIYFGPQAKNKLYQKFFSSLNPGGFFIMGKTEVLLGSARNKFEIFNNKERIFRRPFE